MTPAIVLVCHTSGLVPTLKNERIPSVGVALGRAVGLSRGPGACCNLTAIFAFIGFIFDGS